MFNFGKQFNCIQFSRYIQLYLQHLDFFAAIFNYPNVIKKLTWTCLQGF